MSNKTNNNLNDVLKGALTPFLKSEGYKKSGLVYSRDCGNLAAIVALQKSRWNTGSGGAFTLNFGVHVPGVGELYAGKAEAAKPRIEDCALYVRVGMLTPEHVDRWWEINADMNEAEKERGGRELVDVCKDFGLPFLRRFETLQSIAAWLEAPSGDYARYVFPMAQAQRLAYAAIVLCLCGDSVASARLQRLYSEAVKGTPLEDVASPFLDRLAARC